MVFKIFDALLLKKSELNFCCLYNVSPQNTPKHLSDPPPSLKLFVTLLKKIGRFGECKVVFE